MRRLNDVKKVADFIVSNFKSSDIQICRVEDNSMDIRVPYLPSLVISLVSSEIRIGVFPCDESCVLVNVYKL